MSLPNHENVCSGCNQSVDPLRLYAKKVSFVRKSNRQVARVRTVSYLCDDCLPRDEHWNLDPNKSPGNQSAAQNRIAARRVASNG